MSCADRPIGANKPKINLKVQIIHKIEPNLNSELVFYEILEIYKY